MSNRGFQVLEHNKGFIVTSQQSVLPQSLVQSVSNFLTRAPTLLAFDFDGTLSPIVNNPDNAYLAPEIVPLLNELCNCTHVAVITGRSVSDIRSRLPSSLTEISGNHGLEPLPLNIAAQKSEIEQSVADTATTLEHIFEGDGHIKVERKNLSLSVHYRGHPDPDGAEAKILSTLTQASPGFRSIRGKKVVSLVPKKLPHKGDALVAMMLKKGLHQAVFVGDDVTDEDVFLMNDPNILGIRVGSEVGSAADLFIRDQKAITPLLGIMLQAVCPK